MVFKEKKKKLFKLIVKQWLRQALHNSYLLYQTVNNCDQYVFWRNPCSNKKRKLRLLKTTSCDYNDHGASPSVKIRGAHNETVYKVKHTEKHCCVYCNNHTDLQLFLRSLSSVLCSQPWNFGCVCLIFKFSMSLCHQVCSTNCQAKLEAGIVLGLIFN